MSEMTFPCSSGASAPLDASWRGIPADLARLTADELARMRLKPRSGDLALPLLSLDREVFRSNARTMISLTQSIGALLAPHAKSAMSPGLSSDLIDLGAWGASVADLRQAHVMLEGGIRRIVIANQIGGRRAIARLAALLRRHSQAEPYLFVDSIDTVEALAGEWTGSANLPPLGLLLDIGCGRGGVASNEAMADLAEAIRRVDRPQLFLAGVAGYEGAATRPTAAETETALVDFFDRLSFAARHVRGLVGPERALILSAGGTSQFDRVIVSLQAVLADDPRMRLMLRCGAAYYSDHGPIRARLDAMADRGLLGADISREIRASFQPALRLWAEVLSCPSGQLAICGFGLRDSAHDQGYPTPLHQWRDGVPVSSLSNRASVTKLNDQHAFLSCDPGCDITVGDVIEFGASHPCTSMDKHGLIYAIDEDGAVETVIRTCFG